MGELGQHQFFLVFHFLLELVHKLLVDFLVMGYQHPLVHHVVFLMEFFFLDSHLQLDMVHQLDLMELGFVVLV